MSIDSSTNIEFVLDGVECFLSYSPVADQTTLASTGSMYAVLKLPSAPANGAYFCLGD